MFLEAMRDFEHQVVITPEILEEWKRHRSRFAFRWLTEMFARKLDYRLGDVTNEALREKIMLAAKSERGREEMLKDILLLEAALAADQIVSSLNETDRRRFKSICHVVVEIADVVWVNPDIVAENCIEWLSQGAPAEDHRKLGYSEGSI
jgi:hypothetical protein